MDWNCIDIPPVFHSELTGARFEHCCKCNCNVLTDASGVYQVEKAFRDGQLLYEYALCERCLEWYYGSLSDQSVQHMDEFIAQRVDFDGRHSLLSALSPTRVEPWIDRCLITGKPIKEKDEYQLLAHCAGEQLIMVHTPLAMSGDPVDEILGLLSKESVEQMDRFVRDYLRVPPELLKSSKERRRLMQ